MSEPKKKGRVKGRPELTSRDLELVQFLEKTKLYLNADQASRLFYWNGSADYCLKYAQKRLKILCQDLKEVDRIRDYAFQSYSYYISSTAPRMYKHRLANTEFLSYFCLIEGVEIVDIIHEWRDLEKEYHLRPDLRVEFLYEGILLVMIVEVDVGKSFHNDENIISSLKTSLKSPNYKSYFQKVTRS